MPITPATKDLSTWTTMATAAVPMWLGEGYVEDIVFRENVFLEMLKEKGRVMEKDIGPSIVVPVLDNKSTNVRAWSGLDTFPTQVVSGARGVEFTPSNYVVSVTVADEDTWNAAQGSDLARVSLVETFMDQAILTLAETCNADLIHGNGSDSKKWLGLEQAIFAETHSGGTALTVSQVGARQAANTYGVARVLDAGTGWENIAINGTTGTANGTLGSATAGEQVFGWGTSSNQSPNTVSIATQAFDRSLLLASYGNKRPDFALMTLKPYLDLINMGKGLQRYTRQSGEGGAVTTNMGPGRVYYGDMAIGYTEEAKSSGTYSGQDAAANADMIYFGTLGTWRFYIRKGKNFTWQGFIRAFNQFAEAGAFVASGQLICTNPRQNGVFFNYGKTS